MNTTKIFPLALLPILLLTSCANLSAVRTFASLAPSEQLVSAVIDDYTTSPTRRAAFLPESSSVTTEQETRNRQRAALLALFAVLIDYPRSLGSIAQDDPGYAPEIGRFTSALASAGVTSAPAAESGGRLAAILTRITADGWRSGRLTELIAAAGPDFDSLCAALHEVLAHDFVLSLDLEADALNSFFTPPDTPPAQDPATALLRLSRADHTAALNARRLRLTTAIDQLNALRQSHRALLPPSRPAR